MVAHKYGCVVCGKEIKYFQVAKSLKCESCGLEFESSASCADDHYVCDKCHARAGYESITEYALSGQGDDPVTIAQAMMRNGFIHMHGPEHHYLVVAALLAACKKSGGKLDLAESLSVARQRAEKVPGGICGLWGCCGAAVGSGIFVSIITGANPLSEGEWRLANEMTSLSLAAIARNGGPRCCKRDAFLAVLAAIDFVRESLGLEMKKPESTLCSFFGHNPTCRKQQCLFYPSRIPQEMTRRAQD